MDEDQTLDFDNSNQLPKDYCQGNSLLVHHFDQPRVNNCYSNQLVAMFPRSRNQI